MINQINNNNKNGKQDSFVPTIIEEVASVNQEDDNSNTLNNEDKLQISPQNLF